MKKLIIVGSAPIQEDLSCFIDSCDCVVRFNNCKNYGGNSGVKTNVLFLSNSGDPSIHKTLAFMLRERTTAEVETDLPYLYQASHIWFTRPHADRLSSFIRNQIPNNVNMKKLELEYSSHGRDLAAEITRAQKIPDSKVRKVPPGFHTSVWNNLQRFGRSQAVMPSTGMVGIEIILNDPLYTEYQKKYIVGFGWEGWAGHPWELERKQVALYLEQKQLLRADSKGRLLLNRIKNSIHSLPCPLSHRTLKHKV